MLTFAFRLLISSLLYTLTFAVFGTCHQIYQRRVLSFHLSAHELQGANKTIAMKQREPADFLAVWEQTSAGV